MQNDLSIHYPVSDIDIVLSIHNRHARNIYKGEKIFELRKVLPKEIPRRVFLYDTTERAITGYFCTEYIATGSRQSVWHEVRDSGINRERYFKYFSGRSSAVAFKVSTAIKFSQPIKIDGMTVEEKTGLVPQLFTYVSEGLPSTKTLRQAAINEVVRRNYGDFRFTFLERGDESAFINLVEDSITPAYEETGRKYGEYLVRQHYEKMDPEGFFTKFKLCLKICRCEEFVGFIVLTFKRGGSVKTGPIILSDAHRDSGVGQAMRKALHEMLLRLGARKVYATVPSNHKPAIHYLMASGYSIEAHLNRHYHHDHDEIVFGFFLESHDCNPPILQRSPISVDRYEKTRKIDLDVGLFLYSHFPRIFFSVPRHWVITQIKLASLFSRGRIILDKERMIFSAYAENKVIMSAITIFKRGGSVKIIVSSETNHNESIRKFIRFICKRIQSKQTGVTKIYSHVAASDSVLHNAFVQEKFLVEGLLRRPYNNDTDMFILSRLVT